MKEEKMEKEAEWEEIKEEERRKKKTKNDKLKKE